MGLTKHPNGVSSFGVPILPGTAGALTTGSVFFVHSGTGSNGNSGKDTDHPFSTIDYAVGRCTASKGDIIYVMPGHNESITSATSLVVDVIGVSIIGLGRGRNRPTLDFDNVSGSVEMDAASCRLSNIILRASLTAVTMGINVDADDVELDNLEFTVEAALDDFKTMIDVDAFDRCTISNCYFRSESTAAGAEEAIRIDDSHYSQIVGNQFTGQWSNSAIQGEGALSTDILIADNNIYNADTGATNGINISVASTGLIARNNIGTLYASNITSLLDPGSCLCIENYACNAVDETGSIVPISSSA